MFRTAAKLVAVAAVAACLVASASKSAWAQTQTNSAGDPPVIIAQGEASVKHAPDVAWAQIAVEVRGNKPQVARQKAADAMTSVMTALKRELPADAIKTSSFSVEPEMDYSGGSSSVKDYVARNQVEVRIDDLDKLAAVIDAGATSGATS